MFEVYDLKIHQKRTVYAVKGEDALLKFLIYSENKWMWVLACDFVPISQ